MKVVCVGDEGCGKTALLQTFLGNPFPEVKQPSAVPPPSQQTPLNQAHVPTLHEIYTVTDEDNGNVIELHDTSGSEDMDRLRSPVYEKADLCIICFSVGSRRSLAHVKEKWAPEIAYFLPGVSIVLVACKSDARLDEVSCSELPVSKSEGQAMAQAIKASKYVETSSLSLYQVDRFLDDDVDDSAHELVILSGNEEKTYASNPIAYGSDQYLGSDSGGVIDSVFSPQSLSSVLPSFNPKTESNGEETTLIVTATGVLVDGESNTPNLTFHLDDPISNPHQTSTTGKPTRRPTTGISTQPQRPGSLSSAITPSSIGTSTISPTSVTIGQENLKTSASPDQPPESPLEAYVKAVGGGVEIVKGSSPVKAASPEKPLATEEGKYTELADVDKGGALAVDSTDVLSLDRSESPKISIPFNGMAAPDTPLIRPATETEAATRNALQTPPSVDITNPVPLPTITSEPVFTKNESQAEEVPTETPQVPAAKDPPTKDQSANIIPTLPVKELSNAALEKGMSSSKLADASVTLEASKPARVERRNERVDKGGGCKCTIL
ncbi:GTP-binding protein Rho1 [Dinochytrium kinnereticum]|nr:GTP-binding protein Rho1 [Dinochytrium kinnereticum]